MFIFQLTSQFRYAEAAAVSTLLFALSFVLVLITERLVDRAQEPTMSAPAQTLEPPPRCPRAPRSGDQQAGPDHPHRGGGAVGRPAPGAPLAGIIWTAIKGGWQIVTDTLSAADVRHAFVLTVIITLVTVVVTAVFGTIVALVLARDRFPGRRLLIRAGRPAPGRLPGHCRPDGRHLVR